MTQAFRCIVCGADVLERDGHRWLGLNRWILGSGHAVGRRESRIGDPNDSRAEDVYVWNDTGTDPTGTSLVTACVPGCLAIFAEMQSVEMEQDRKRRGGQGP